MAFWSLKTSANDPNYTECHFRFAGQYEDAETGLYYNRFRYYDKDTGQYISPDPIGLEGGFNPYGYVHCPVGWVDPFGLSGTSQLSTVQKNKQVGDGVRDDIARELGTTTIEQNFRVTGGLRRMDVVDNRIGIESKVGRTGLTSRVRQELARDIKILRQENAPLDAIEWHFTKSPTTGKIGPTPRLEDKLNKYGIPIIYRD
ncbi:RHS repeat-associated core domain-containing protein [Morganella morganii]|uniref:RHS repeat-associated core domain-containing protein n=1 Tax=Morganella morganii TaxID=582 RepID=UPI00339CA367